VDVDLTTFRFDPEGHDPNLHGTADSQDELLTLPHLKLYKVDVDQIWCCLAATIDFSNLKTLALYNCKDDTFYGKFVSSLNCRSPALEHVYVTIDNSDPISDLLHCCENLTSLHLVWTMDCNLDKFWRMIERRGPGLKSLGVHQPNILDPFGGASDELSRLLSTCQNVQHLRLPIDIEVMEASTWEEDEDYTEFVVSRIL